MAMLLVRRRLWHKAARAVRERLPPRRRIVRRQFVRGQIVRSQIVITPVSR
jgi:hypothetical protein